LSLTLTRSKHSERAIHSRNHFSEQSAGVSRSLSRYGYTYRIAVSIDDVPYVFEPDEEGSYRVLTITNSNDASKAPAPDSQLLEAIAEKLRGLQ
jgi:hypothetical protein